METNFVLIFHLTYFTAGLRYIFGNLNVPVILKYLYEESTYYYFINKADEKKVAILLGFPATAGLIGFCPNGWIRFEDSCYLFEDIQEDWNTSRTFCQSFNADLVVPDTEPENSFIKSHLTNIYTDCQTKGYYWFGMTDKAEAGEWNLVTTGGPPSFTDWAARQPDETGHCAAFYGVVGYKWDDYVCGAKRMFICEYQDTIQSSIVGK